MKKMHWFNFFIVLNFFLHVEAMHRGVVEPGKTVLKKVVTGMVQQGATNILKTGSPEAFQGVAYASTNASSLYAPYPVNNSFKPSVNSTYQQQKLLIDPYNKPILPVNNKAILPVNVEHALQLVDTKSKEPLSDQQLNIFDVDDIDNFSDQSKSVESSGSLNSNSIDGQLLNHGFQNYSSLYQVGKNRLFGKNFVAPQSLDLRAVQESIKSSESEQNVTDNQKSIILDHQVVDALPLQSINLKGSFSALPVEEKNYAIKQKESSQEVNNLRSLQSFTSGASLPVADQSRALQVYGSPSMRSLPEEIMLDGLVKNKIFDHDQTQLPSWIDNLIHEKSVHESTLVPVEFSDRFRLVKAPKTINFLDTIHINNFNDKLLQDRSENVSQVSFDTHIDKSNKDLAVLQENEIFQDFQTLIMQDQSTMIVAGNIDTQPVLIVGDSQGQFGLILTATHILEFGFVDSQGQPSIITITDPSILLDQNHPGVRSLLDALPANIRMLLPKFIKTQAVQKVLQVALSPQTQSSVALDAAGKKMITVPAMQISSSTQQALSIPFEPNKFLKIQNNQVNRASDIFADLQISEILDETDLQSSKVKLQRQDGPKFAIKAPLGKAEKDLLNFDDIFEEDEVQSSDVVQDEPVDKILNPIDATEHINDQPLFQPKNLIIPKNLEQEVRQIAVVEFNSLPKNSSRLGKILAMLQKIQEMIMSFVGSIGSYDSYAQSLQQKQIIELARKKAARKLAAEKMNSATWLEIIQEFMAEIWAILTSKKLKENYHSVNHENISE